MIQTNNLEAIATQIFDVKKVQLHSNVPGYDTPESYGVYNTTSGRCLGVVGNQYTPTQPSELMGNFIDCLGSNNVDFEALKYSELKGGAKVLFSSPYKTISFKNMRGIQDESIISINLQTGYDGLTKTSLFLSLFRLVCSNGMKANRTEFTASFKNTAGNKGRINNICTDVTKSLNMFSELEQLLLHLNSVPVTQLAVKNFLQELTGIDINKAAEESTRSLNIYNDLLQSIEKEFSRTGASAWGLLNGVTYYTNHVAKADNRQDFLLVDKGETLNRKAQELVTAM